jgi:ketosteroid isomerase-like protein
VTPADVVRSVYAAINARDDRAFELLADEFEWHEPQRSLLGRSHRGAAEVRQALEIQLEVFDEFHLEPEELHERGDRVAVRVRQRAGGGVSGAEVEIRIGHLWTVRDGRLVRLEVFAARDDARRVVDDAPG